MSLFDVKHQSAAQLQLQQAVAGDRVPHAYLFHGPDGVGKEMVARGIAELLLCPDPIDKTIEADREREGGVEKLRVGCGVCEDCRSVAGGTHPDLHLIYRQLNRDHPDADVRNRKALEISVDVMRHFVIGRVGLTPVRGRAKLFIVREADRATAQAQNALLKTLEEPPGATVIILLVRAMDRLLPTTRSRCQTVRFDALPTSFVQSKLGTLRPDVSTEQIAWYARCSEGSIGRAVEYSEDALYGLNQRLLEGLTVLSGADDNVGAAGGLTKVWTLEAKSLGESYRKRDPDISETEAGRRGLKSVFQLAANWYADVLRVAGGDASNLVNGAWHEQIERSAAALGIEQAAQAITRIVRTEQQLDLNANTQLCVEALLSDLARIGNGEPIAVL